MPFPDRLEDVQKLVADHEQIEREPLQFAIYYAPDSASDDVYLFEVADQFGYNEVAPYHELMEVVYASTPGFPFARNGQLHLILTNPVEAATAVEQGWDKISDLRNAILAQRYKIVYDAENNAEEFVARLKSGVVAA